MNPALHDDSAPRYGCLECREDAELVVGDRLHAEGLARYHAHLRGCEGCRRAHQLLSAVYRGPDPGSSGHGIVARDREFTAILRKVRAAAPVSWYRQNVSLVGVAALAAALAWVVVRPEGGPASQVASRDLPDLLARQPTGPAAQSEPARAAGLDHHAQADYGRVVAGNSFVAEGERPVATDTFPVGTRFEVFPGSSMQIGLVGKILANFGSGSEIHWTRADPGLVELDLRRGMIAVRYERLPADPILKIRTPSAIVRVVGTVFTVEVDDDGDTAVAVLRGEVEVLDLKSEDLLAEVSAGYRFDVARSTYADVGRPEVGLAMPLSDGDGDGQFVFADGTIPPSWVVPGLPDVPGLRRLEHIVVRTADARPRLERPHAASHKRGREARGDDGQALIDKLVRETRASRREQLMASLAHCQGLYESAETRYLSARCLTQFMSEHGDDDIAEGHLLIGILRMDFANDYPAAKQAFEKFLARAPDHADVELARYRLWLASTENGDIHEAIEHGRDYLRRHPDGKYAGKILQRFPQLVSEL
ncbi:FecR domain-containing protein [Nannocystis bainbridge]|uniref:FecR domain-containing protein n=1 Tax=Nannocystis bainbridge TaxID=2995303 RepID=A0ABT5DXT3_9BACT|nr:FecR domain-containing protein [Nannocystis bainbridge]MDC0718436.1 FecR domain-containing protein [Nannocystis bainbridge]